MPDPRSNSNVATRSEVPGDRLVAAIEAATDRIIAAQKRAIWRLTVRAVLVVTVAMMVLVLVGRS